MPSKKLLRSGPDTKTKSANLPMITADDVAGYWAWKLAMGWQRRAEAALRPLLLTHLQYAILSITAQLLRSDPVVMQRDIVRFSTIHEGQVSIILKTLKGKGFILQQKGTQDPRAKLISLTKEGMDVLLQGNEIIAALQARLWPKTGDVDAFRHKAKTILADWEK